MNKPLLPKTNQDFKSGPAAGEWIVDGVGLFNRLGNSLEFEAGANREINSIPSPWSRPLQLISAFRNPNYPSRDWLIAQYRGLLTTLALAENLGLKIAATQVRLQDYQNREFGRCLWKLRPNERDSVLHSQPADGPWGQLYLFELENVVIGMTSPATLVCPTGYFPDSLKKRVAWIKNGFFVDPIGNGLAPNHREVLVPWLEHLKGNLMRSPQDENLAGRVDTVLSHYVADLGVTTSTVFQPTTQSLPFGIPLAPAPLNALYPAEAVQSPSNVKVIASPGRQPSKQLYLIDPVQLPSVFGRNLEDINVIDNASLLNFDPNHHQRADALFVSPGDVFQENLYYQKNKGLLPGTWLDQKLNLDNLTILLPLKDFVREYFTSEDLEKQVVLSPVATPEGPGVRVSLTVQLSGFNRSVNYTMFREYALKAENEIKQDFPTLALWPNVPPTLWKEYFLLVETTEEYGELAFRIQQPTPTALPENRRSGQESYQYWKCDSYPDILSAIDKNAQPLGLIPLKIPKAQGGHANIWTIGVDFGTSFTNIYVRKGAAGTPERLQLQTHLLKITGGLEDIQTVIYREFFIPDILVPQGQNPPMVAMITTRGWQESDGNIPELIKDGRIYFPRLDRWEFNKEYIRSNIKWENVQHQRPFLAQLTRMIAVQAAWEEVKDIEWSISYPSAFSIMDVNRYKATWKRVLESLASTSYQTHRMNSEGLITESVAFAQFFADVLKKNLINTTCIDIGGGTSDISIWRDNVLIHQVSVPFAGRNIFHRILEGNLKYSDEIFGLPPEAARSLENVLSGKNFDSSLDVYIRSNSKQILSDGYVNNCSKRRNKEFRTLVAFAVGGLFHYVGLIQKILHEKQGHFSDGITTTFLFGGNGSRYFHWLSPSGEFNETSEVNKIFQGILTKSSNLQYNPEISTLSAYPKEEVCGGLVISKDGENLKGISTEQKNYPFLGERCKINDQVFESEELLKLDDEWEEIETFEITSFTELEKYIESFNQIIKEKEIQEVDLLRNYDGSGIYKLSNDDRILLSTRIKRACLKKQGSVSEFEAEPAFFIVLKCFIELLAEKWSKN